MRLRGILCESFNEMDRLSQIYYSVRRNSYNCNYFNRSRIFLPVQVSKKNLISYYPHYLINSIRIYFSNKSDLFFEVARSLKK